MLLSVVRQTMEGGTAFVCENCGRTIFNYAKVRHVATGEENLVGIECGKTLCQSDEDSQEMQRLAKWLPKMESHIKNGFIFRRHSLGNNWIEVLQPRISRGPYLIESFKAKDFPTSLLKAE